MRILSTISAAALIAILSPSAMAQTGEGPDRKALFGELHMHTWWSLQIGIRSPMHPPLKPPSLQLPLPCPHVFATRGTSS